MNKVYLARGELPDRALSHARALSLARRIERAAGWEEDGIGYLENGKPVFRRSGRHLSVSHAGGILVVAASEAPVGVDLEVRRPFPPGVAARWYDPEERAMDPFFVWTAKEAVSKISGEGLALLGRIRVRENGAFCGGEGFSLYREERDGAALTVACPLPFTAVWVEE